MSIADDFIDVVSRKNEFTNFTPQLFRLMFKADRDNMERLAWVFPDEAELLYWWRGSPKQPDADDIREFVRVQELRRQNAKDEKEAAEQKGGGSR